MLGFYDFREFGEKVFPIVAVCCVALGITLYVWGNQVERSTARSTPEKTTAVFERIGPHFEYDGLYRVDYESKTYLIYQHDDHAAIIEHKAAEEKNYSP